MIDKEMYDKIVNEIPSSVLLVAVSKTKPNADIQSFYDIGHRDFGENRVQELTDKYESLPKDIHWHMIGHLQTNKVKYIAPFVHLIHGVDSLKLLKEINKQGRKNQRVIDCLLQFHIAEEESKFGFDVDEYNHALAEIKTLENISVKGVMGMATYTDNKNQIRKEFKSLKKLSEIVRGDFPDAIETSMGMSGDYNIAIEEGSSMIRLGSILFGSR